MFALNFIFNFQVYTDYSDSLLTWVFFSSNQDRQQSALLIAMDRQVRGDHVRYIGMCSYVL